VKERSAGGCILRKRSEGMCPEEEERTEGSVGEDGGGVETRRVLEGVEE